MTIFLTVILNSTIIHFVSLHVIKRQPSLVGFNRLLFVLPTSCVFLSFSYLFGCVTFGSEEKKV